jgi:hypothetical protein
MIIAKEVRVEDIVVIVVIVVVVVVVKLKVGNE